MTATLTTIPKSTPPSVADDPRWARIAARDKTADGHFWYSVVTTGVYCRPSCPSRIANPKNVQLYDSLESAKATGFRPCRRCNPDGPSTDCENADGDLGYYGWDIARNCELIRKEAMAWHHALLPLLRPLPLHRRSGG
jgi:methylphosphotriester-DNA--protein-cysteine methyltransferase